jgi:thiosulfate dehydrogenase [quinone] large subunit
VIHAKDPQIAYALFRFSLGVNLAMHGVNRIVGGLDRFASKMVDDFAATMLPRAIVWPFGAGLPCVELAVGVLLVFGAFTWSALVIGALTMAALMFGTALRGDWNVLGLQLIYSFAYYVLLAKRSDDAYGVDVWRRSTTRGGVGSKMRLLEGESSRDDA